MRLDAKNVPIFALTLISIWSWLPAFGNDSAASVGAGGIQLKREARISMEKERLTISVDKVTVEYEFLNDADQDITTEVAFPVPPYDEHYLDTSFPKGLDDFRVWVDGRETKYQVDAAAMLNGVDYTELLRSMGVDVASLGHFTEDQGDPRSQDIEKLSPSQRGQLLQLGLIRSDNGFMGWTVAKIYHWRQTFRANKILHVRHEYAPIRGFTLLEPEVVFPVPKQDATPEFAAAVRDSCIDDGLQKKLISAARKEDRQESGYIRSQWVDYILTTANTWKTPIKDFELIVERPKPEPPGARSWFVSFCWDGPVKRLDADHFGARAVNFVPTRELHIAFVGIE